MSNIEVAERLSITESTVKTHLNNIFQKLGVRDRLELTHYAIKTGMVAVIGSQPLTSHSISDAANQTGAAS